MYYRHIAELGLTPEEILEYLRKSRSDDPTLTVEEVLENHERRLDEWAERNFGAKVPEENKYREVVSGETLKERPEINALLRKIESPRYKAVLVVELTRLSRGDLEDAGRLIKLFRHTNTLIITPERVYDMRDEYDREAVERELKRGNEYLEYTKKILNNGRLQSVSQGNYIGSKPPYGYNRCFVAEGKKKCPTLVPNSEQADVVRMIFDMYVNQDMGTNNIAYRLDELGVKPATGDKWSVASIRDMLSNVHYIGKVRWNWRKTVAIVEDGEIINTQPRQADYLIYEGKHDAIISNELFQAAQEKRGKNHRAKAKTKIRNPFAGLVFCQCGRSMTYRTYLKNGAYRSAPRLLCDNQRYCKTSSCRFEEMLSAVREVLIKSIHDYEILLQTDNDDSAKLHRSLIKRLEAKRAELDKKEIAQWEAQADPDPSKRMPDHVFKVLNERLLKEKEEVRQALCKAYESMPEPVDYTVTLKRFKDALEALDNPEATPALQNKLLRACIERIDYNREKSVRVKRAPGEKKGTTLQVGSAWTEPKIEIDVKLKV